MKHREHLPQLDGGLFLTDGGIETTLIFHGGCGQALADAIREVDAETAGAPVYYMINCAHPVHFEGVIGAGGPWDRVCGLRANASTRSHAELDEATELDEGDPADLGARDAAVGARLPALNVLGGCCGTDHRHVAEICRAWPAR